MSPETPPTGSVPLTDAQSRTRFESERLIVLVALRCTRFRDALLSAVVFATQMAVARRKAAAVPIHQARTFESTAWRRHQSGWWSANRGQPMTVATYSLVLSISKRFSYCLYEKPLVVFTHVVVGRSAQGRLSLLPRGSFM